MGLNEALELTGIFPIHAPISRDNKELFLFVPPHSQAGGIHKQAGEVILLDFEWVCSLDIGIKGLKYIHSTHIYWALL